MSLTSVRVSLSFSFSLVLGVREEGEDVASAETPLGASRGYIAKQISDHTGTISTTLLWPWLT